MAGEALKLGQFTPDPNRHQGFEFVDQESGDEYSIEDLSVDPQDPDWQVGTLVNTLDDGSMVLPPVVVTWEKGLIREAEPFVVIPRERQRERQMAATAMISRIAVGSLVVQLKEAA